jgi:uncharacterized protein (DUF1697 family)
LGKTGGGPSSISRDGGASLPVQNKMKDSSRTPCTYIALLRGINLGGHKIVKMDQLRKTFEELGFADVKTYIQSGNVVFKAPAQISAKLAKRIEEKILSQFGFPVPVVIKTAVEIGEVISSNPLLKEKGIDPAKLHVTFLACEPDKSALKALDATEVAPDQFRCSAQAVYLHCPNGYHATKLGNNVLEKMLKVGTTTRNWNTVNKLWEMARS